MRSLKKKWTWTRPGFEIWDGQQSEVEGLFLAGSGCDVTNLEMCEINKWCNRWKSSLLPFRSSQVHHHFLMANSVKRGSFFSPFFLVEARPPHRGDKNWKYHKKNDSPVQFLIAPVLWRWCKSILVCVQHHRNPTDGKKTGHRQISTLSGLSDIQVIFLWHVWRRPKVKVQPPNSPPKKTSPPRRNF